jgi:hypothetical protein
MDVLSERILKYLLEEISNILHAAMDLHIVDVAMTWARPFFQKPQPGNAEVCNSPLPCKCILIRVYDR